MWCAECHQPCGVKQIDVGVGDLDYCGHQISTTQWVTVSACCEADLLEEEPVEEESCQDL